MSGVSSWTWLVLIAIAYLIWRSARKSSSAPADRRYPPTDGGGRTVPRIRGDGRFATEVVGESFYRPAFRALLQKHQPEDLEDEWTGDAVLRLDDDNPHDKNAVAVYLEELHVGHLSRETAADFRQALVRDGFPQLREVAVPAKLYWGGEDEIFSVSLDLPQA